MHGRTFISSFIHRVAYQENEYIGYSTINNEKKIFLTLISKSNLLRTWFRGIAQQSEVVYSNADRLTFFDL